MTPLPRLSACELDQRILIEAGVKGRNVAGGETRTWSEAGGAGKGKRWAKVIYGTGVERRQAAQEQAWLTATFRVRDDSLTRAVTADGHRIQYEGGAWDIASNVRYGRDGRDITATRKA